MAAAEYQRGHLMDVTAEFGSQAITQQSGTSLRRIMLSSVIGTAVEWYDFMIYATATALVFNKLFFPTSAASLSTIVAFGTYAVGFFARPVGAAIFGHYGDKIGRKAMLAATIAIMGVGTFLIGLLPTYGQIGVAAPLLLVFLRLLQGIGLGGEWGGAVLMVVENAPVRHRGLLGSMVQIGNPIGVLAAVGIFALVSKLPDASLMQWGWRIPFLISIFLVGVGLYVRLSLAETPVFRQMKLRNEVSVMPIMEILTHHRRPFFTAIGLKISEIAYASIASIFVISYATGHLGLPRSLILNAVLMSAAVALVSIPAFGWLADKLGRKTMFTASCLFSIAFAFPLFWLLDTKDPTIITLTVVAAISFGQMVGFGIGAPWYSELFPARLRYSGASLGFQIGAAISGGLSPVIAASLMAWSGGKTWPISIYLIVCGCITLAATIAAPETAQKELT
jgi:MHS family shikimate/dehydroshikimate transporter-like MFS transporter